MLVNKHEKEINNENLIKAIENTFKKRNTEFNISMFKEIVEMLQESDTLKKVFTNYQSKLEYTKNVTYNDTIKSIIKIINILESNLVIAYNG